MKGPTLWVAERRVQLGDGLYRRSRTLIQPGLRVQLVSTAGCQTDTRAIQRAFPEIVTPRHSFTVVLEGEYESEAAGRVGPAEAAYEVRSAWHERWGGPRQRFVVVTWERGAEGGGVGVDGIGSAGLATWRALAERIEHCTEDDAGPIAEAALEAVRAAGARPPRLETTVAPAAVRRMGLALNHVFTHLHETPQWVDMEGHTQVGARQLRRVFAAQCDWLAGGSWRRTLLTQRLSLAVSLLGARASTAAEVAAALGYGGDRALFTALRRAGLGASHR